MSSSSSRTPFNVNFDKEFSDGLIADMQKWCFNSRCGATNPSKRCVKCKLAAYCGRDCQVEDWNLRHKDRCKIWRDNRSAKKQPDGLPLPPTCVPIALRSVHCVEEYALPHMIGARQHLFLEEMKRCHLKMVKFETSVIALVSKIRLVCGATFWGERPPILGQSVFVNHVMVEDVDDWNDDTYAQLYPNGEGTRPGRISDAAQRDVHRAWMEFAQVLRKYKFTNITIHYGRGLTYLKENDEFWTQMKGVLGDGTRVDHDIVPMYQA